jgi:hypothetical protein
MARPVAPRPYFPFDRRHIPGADYALGGLAVDSLCEETWTIESMSFENVMLAPHMAGSPRANELRDNIEDVIAGIVDILAA